MVNFKKLTDRAKDVVDKRGGPDALKSDAKEVAGIMKGKGSLKDKAAKAKEAVRDAGERGPGREGGGQSAQARQHGGAPAPTENAPDEAKAMGVSHAQPPVDSADEADKRP